MAFQGLIRNQTETPPEGETVTLHKGSIPPWLHGNIYTTAPGKFKFTSSNSSPDFTVNSFSDGFAIISKFTLHPQSNQINMRTLYERSDARRKADAAGKPVMAEYFTKSSPDVTKNRLSRWMSILPENSDNGNHNIYKFGEDLFTTNGLSHFRQLHPEDLSLGAKFDTNKLFSLSGLTPHPIIDHDGHFYNTGSAVTPTGAKQVIIRVPAITKRNSNSNFAESAKRFEIVASFPMSRAMHCTIHHSFALTKNYVVLVEQPFSFNVKKLLSWVFSGNPTALNDMAEWLPEESARGNAFLVVDKKSGRLLVKREITTAVPFFFLHFVNSYEDVDQDGRPIIVLDIVTFPNTNATITALSTDFLRQGLCCAEKDEGIIERYVIPLPIPYSLRKVTNNKPRLNFGTSFKVMEEKLEERQRITVYPGAISERGIKSVVINPRFRFSKYRFAYANSGCSYNHRGRYGGSIVKFDLLKGEEKRLELGKDGEGCFVGEMVFVPRTTDICAGEAEAEEDDGVIICAVYSADINKNACVVFICAKKMEEVGRAKFEHDVPIAGHAIFVAN